MRQLLYFALSSIVGVITAFSTPLINENQSVNEASSAPQGQPLQAQKPSAEKREVTSKPMGQDTLVQKQNQPDYRFRGLDLDRLQHIYFLGEDGKSREDALDTIARSEDPRAQAVLLHIYESGEASDREKTRILGFLEPKSLDDDVGRFLVKQFQDPSAFIGHRMMSARVLIELELNSGESAGTSKGYDLSSYVPADLLASYENLVVTLKKERTKN